MKKFFSFLKMVFTIYAAFRREREKTKMLIQNVNQLFDVVQDARDYQEKQGIEGGYLLSVLNIKNIKKGLMTAQKAKGLLDAIADDVEVQKLIDKEKEMKR